MPTTLASATDAPSFTFTEQDRRRLHELVRRLSFKSGSFTLASGRTSSKYFNMKPTMMDPEGAKLCAASMLELLSDLDPEYVGGLEMGAVPILSALGVLSYDHGRPVGLFFVRKKPKEHGAKLQIEGLPEGASLSGKRVVVVDDVATTGGSILQAVEIARELGAEVRDAAVLVDRDEGARDALAAHGVRLHGVFDASEFD